MSHMLKAEDAAKQLGLSRSKTYQMLQRDELPCVRIGRSVRVPQDRLTAYLQARSNDVQTTHGSGENAHDLSRLFSDAGFDDLGECYTLQQALPALMRLSRLCEPLAPIERLVLREECVRRLVRAKVRMPARAADLALGLSQAP
jgi:excisionase family DNA binding protein